VVFGSKRMLHVVCEYVLRILLRVEIAKSGQTFIAHFRAFWPRTLEFWRKDHLLSANNWGKVLKLAEKQQGDVMLKLKIAYDASSTLIKRNYVFFFLKPLMSFLEIRPTYHACS
jgi:hypothetical protein